MNRNVYKVLICLSVCLLLTAIFAGCKSSVNKNEAADVTTSGEKTYEYEYQKIMEENGYVLIENAVAYESNVWESNLDYYDYNYYYKDHYNERGAARTDYEPYLVIGEKIKSETYVKDLGYFTCRCEQYGEEPSNPDHLAYYRDIITITTVRIDKIIKKYFDGESTYDEGMYLYFLEEGKYDDSEKFFYEDGKYYFADFPVHYRVYSDDYTEDRQVKSVYNAIPDGKSLFFFCAETSGFIKRSTYTIEIIDMKGIDILVDFSFISLEKNVMDLNLGPYHRYISQAQADYPMYKEDE